jgi:hypothetical protein
MPNLPQPTSLTTFTIRFNRRASRITLERLIPRRAMRLRWQQPGEKLADWPSVHGETGTQDGEVALRACKAGGVDVIYKSRSQLRRFAPPEFARRTERRASQNGPV